MNPDDRVDTVKGIGPKKSRALEDAGIVTLEDALYFFPRGYEDRRNVTEIADLKEGKIQLIKAVVLSKRYHGSKYQKNLPLSLTVADKSASMEIVFFNAGYLVNSFSMNETFMFFGKVTSKGGVIQMVHPQYFREGSSEDIRDIIPVYPQIQGVNQKDIRKIVSAAYETVSDIDEWIPEDILRANRVCGIRYAIENIHFPKDGRKVLEAKFRMVFDELLTLEIGLMYMKSDRRREKGISIECRKSSEYINSLPFDLTEGQKEAWNAIKRDLESSQSMNRLLQGDVGSGKTVIAQLAMYCAFKSGYQSVIMAPTELLTRQHFRTFQEDFADFGVTVGLLCSSMKEKDRRITREKLESGEIDILVATHAVLEDNVRFKNLGLAVTDEQHRFGVGQRKNLSGKGKNINVLVMTATPIPRTLAVILYGNLDISQIRTMPEGRKPVTTLKSGKTERSRMYNFVETEIQKGRQVYVVAPLIEDSEKLDAVSAEELFDELKVRFRKYNVALVHGRMKQEEKDAVMSDFVSGKTDMLVSTVVIEVGINVPNASVMVIENAERFGLAQLHQLRGRVGRGSEKSYCILMSDSKTETAEKRMEIMCATSDGFVIAEEDLKIRGPGEIFGTRQHGIPELHVSDILRHADVLESARLAAKDIIAEDPSLAGEKYQGLRKRVRKLFGDDIKLDL